MVEWWTRLNNGDRLIVVFLLIIAGVSFYFAFPLTRGYLPAHLNTLGMGLLVLSPMLLQGVAGTGVHQRLRNAPLLAHHFFGAGIGTIVCGWLLRLNEIATP